MIQIEFVNFDTILEEVSNYVHWVWLENEFVAYSPQYHTTCQTQIYINTVGDT